MAEKTNLAQPLRAARTSGKDIVFFHIWTSHRGIKSVTSVIQRMRESELTQNKLIESRYVQYGISCSPACDIKKTKPPIHQFKVLQMSLKAFKMKKEGLKCILE